MSLKKTLNCFFIFTAVTAFVFIIASPANAAIVQCGRGPSAPVAEQRSCTVCDILGLISNIINYITTIIVPALATLLFLFAGFLIILGGGVPSQISRGKDVFWKTIWGLVIIYSAWLITNTIIQSLAGDNNASTNWFTIDCVGAPSSQIGQPSGQSTAGQPSADQSSTSSNGTCTGKTCSDSNVNICSPIATQCSQTAVNKWDSQIVAGTSGIVIGSGINTVKLVKAIMARESGGVPGKTSFNGSSYGIMQLQPATANKYKTGCTTDSIDSAWLLSSEPAKIQASICIAAKYMVQLAKECGASVREIAAGYNGGSLGLGACDVSTNCGPAAAAQGGECKMCADQTGPTRRWECLWDDNTHQTCNADRSGNFSETRNYAPKVLYCYSQF